MMKLRLRDYFTYAFVSSLALTACAQKSADIPLKGETSPYLFVFAGDQDKKDCLLYTSPSPRDLSTSRMPSSA